MIDCAKCKGSGIEEYWNHGYGEESIEAIKCSECDGFGYIDLLTSCGTFNPEDCSSAEDLGKLIIKRGE